MVSANPQATIFKPESSSSNISARFHIYQFSRDDCLAALRGESLPHALGLPLTRLCVIRGIRHHSGFGEELYGTLPDFTRAIIARRIMSGKVPVDLAAAATLRDEPPYCIWHPDLPPEETCRELVRCYPSMRYQVARTCAVAGYIKLYFELVDVLPEVHIAEEARESGNTAIFNAIMEAPIRYNIMDDYTRTVNATDPKSGARLNGDTAVRWMLDIKQQFTIPDIPPEGEDPEEFFSLWQDNGYRENIFNITEDMNIAENDSDPRKSRCDVTYLLSIPLPNDLPTVDKDLLILAAAYYGDVDRYARLRRHKPIPKELNCIVRGIYHSTPFALWWARQPTLPSVGAQSVRKAIHARFIMNNVIAPGIITCPASDLPNLIWYPSLATPSTYRALACQRSEMTPQILQACVVGGQQYRELFDELLLGCKLTPELLTTLSTESNDKANGYYRKALELRTAELGVVLAPPRETESLMSTRRMLNSGKTTLYRSMDTGVVGIDFDGFYDGMACDFSSVELHACLPQEWKLPEDREEYTELDRLQELAGINEPLSTGDGVLIK